MIFRYSQKYFILLIKSLFVVIPFLLILQGCKNPPEYPNTPAIKYGFLNKVSFTGQDSLTIGLTFRDGDGNLGLDENDVDGSSIYVGDFKYNYFVEIDKSVNGNWERIDFIDLGFPEQHSRFPRLLPEGVGPIEGDLNWSYRTPLSPTSVFQSGDTIRFEIYVLDRDLNQSNIIVTDSVRLGLD